MAIEGFLNSDAKTSLQAALKNLGPGIKWVANYSPKTVWEQETMRLPWSLRRYRFQLRNFAQTVLKEHSLSQDLTTDQDIIQSILVKAGKSGLLSDVLPPPWGDNNWFKVLRPLAMSQVLKMEELCAACGGLGTMLGAHGLGGAPILFSGSLSAIKRFILPCYKSNRNGVPDLLAFAITEPELGSDAEESYGASLAMPRTIAKKSNEGWVINGRKVFITGGDLANRICVFAALEGEGMDSWTCFIVEKGMPGFSAGRNELKMGQKASSASELIFNNVLVPPTHQIGKLRGGWAINRAVLNISRMPVGAIALGIARGAMENAIEFVCSQKVGGKTLINYQDVQQKVAQMYMETSAMRAMLWQSANSWTPTQFHSSATKVFCSDTSVKICYMAMDILGNHSLLHKNGVEKSFRDARLTQIFEGTNQINRLGMIEDQLEQLENIQARSMKS
jgi:alkylation response protein AidB-like acyl-CoA dehydrogenase